MKKKGRRKKRRSQEEVGGRRTQLTVMAVKRSLGVTSCLPPPQSLLTWAGYDGRLTGTPRERLILTLGKSRLFTAPLLHCCCILAKKKISGNVELCSFFAFVTGIALAVRFS